MSKNMKELLHILNKFYLYQKNIFFPGIINKILNKIIRYSTILINFINKKITLYKKGLIWIAVSFIILVNIGGFFIFATNDYYTILFYPAKKKQGLVAERRPIIKGENREEKIRNIIEELFLGPVNPDLYNIYSKEAKLLSLRMENDNLFLNISRETLMDVESKSNRNISIYYLLLESIVNSVCFQDRNINRIKFYFNGKEYRYIGDYGPIDAGLKPDWDILIK